MKSMKFSIDRIETGIAVLISRDDISVRITIPSTLLPPGSGEGSIVSLSIVPDDEETRAARNRVLGLQKKLKSGG
jgi:hypothetical protein